MAGKRRKRGISHFTLHRTQWACCWEAGDWAQDRLGKEIEGTGRVQTRHNVRAFAYHVDETRNRTRSFEQPWRGSRLGTPYTQPWKGVRTGIKGRQGKEHS